MGDAERVEVNYAGRRYAVRYYPDGSAASVILLRSGKPNRLCDRHDVTGRAVVAAADRMRKAP